MTDDGRHLGPWWRSQPAAFVKYICAASNEEIELTKKEMKDCGMSDDEVEEMISAVLGEL